MQYKALYRKYRPKSFKEVVGQKVVLKILQNSIKNNTISHAYIFNGSRGTGKTSIAKIFARAVNCTNNIDGDLCGKCDKCIKKDSELIDIIEIDAASNNGVDEIREIRNNVNVLPSYLKYKVYIIDEVHMLSTSAFNALLKTLEEPPEHIIFILATTEINKIPSTVLSRCQKIDFKKIPDKYIYKHLNEILVNENRMLNSDVVDTISKLADGSFRDAINLLDQILSYNDDQITIDELYEIIGMVSKEKIFELIDYIIDKNIDGGIELIDELSNQSKNFLMTCNLLNETLTDIIINNNTHNYFNENYENTLSKYTKINNNYLFELSELFNSLSYSIKKTNNTEQMFKIYFIKSCKIFEKNNDVENKNIVVKKNNDDDIKFKNDDIINLYNVRINNTLATASKEYKDIFTKSLQNIENITADKNNFNVIDLIKKADVQVVGKSNVIFSMDNNVNVVLFNKNLLNIENILLLLTKNNYKPICVTRDEWIKIKKTFILNKKNGIIYEYVDESCICDENSNVENNDIQNIFGNAISSE